MYDWIVGSLRGVCSRYLIETGTYFSGGGGGVWAQNYDSRVVEWGIGENFSKTDQS